MQYLHTCSGIFQNRPNRFIANVLIDGHEEVCHVKNTGRCRELLLPGATVYQFDDDVREIDAKDSLEWIMMQRFMDDPDAAVRAFLEP